jgi:hypothetical protein
MEVTQCLLLTIKKMDKLILHKRSNLKFARMDFLKVLLSFQVSLEEKKNKFQKLFKMMGIGVHTLHLMIFMLCSLLPRK